MRFLCLLVLLVLPGAVWSACEGQDIRSSLNAAARAEIEDRLAEVPYQTGNHWTATKGDRVMHIIGTLHIDNPQMAALSTRLQPIIEKADLLLVEATLEDQKQLMRDMATKPDLAFLTGPTLIELMPEEDWDALAQAARERGIPPFMAAKFQPWYLSLILSMSPCAVKEAAKGGEGLDHRLMTIAAEADVPVASLEPYTTVFSLFAQDSLEEQISLLSVGILPTEVSENATTTLVAQYFEEAHMAALETSRVYTRPLVKMPPSEFDILYDEFIDLIVDERNKNWLGPIEDAKGELIVVAAGALHLGGEFGLLNMLEQLGYTLERQPF